MKHLVVGLLAHVDAGKTTLTEGLLYQGGSLKKLGRVDHQDAFLDTESLEKERGITIFSKMAQLPLPRAHLTLLDTPGHVDFSGEMERTLQVLDYAILVISGTDGVQSHTQTLWRLLERYEIPTFLFVNKMDLPGADRTAILGELQRRFGDACLSFDPQQPPQMFWENLALQDEATMETYLEGGSLELEQIAALIARRKVFPCYFGAALRLQGLEALLEGLQRYTMERTYPEEFGAKVYKIARDPQGNRLTYLKITGGSLAVKAPLQGESATGEPWQEKADQIRLYSGSKFQLQERVCAGTVCAVTGLSHTWPGEGLGQEPSSPPPVLQPVLSCQLLPQGCDPFTALQKLAPLEEEDPQLHMVWNEALQEIHLQMMGEVQLDVLKRVIGERFGLTVDFGPGTIVYRETIAAPVEGIGHFEPLRHYAEVHLLLEPLPRGSGLQFASFCSEEMLDGAWQRLVLTHLAEKEHVGVLTGSPITDLKITLVAGRGHLKHTEGGDFRQATYRAVRQGLMQAENILLEPWYDVQLQVPGELVGRAMADLQRMGGAFDPPQQEGEFALICGRAPVSAMQGYALEVAGYTRGKGRLFCSPRGYEPCHNQEQVVQELGYDPERDLENPADSVFCAHGAGFVVKWNQVSDFAHIKCALFPQQEEERPTPRERAGIPSGGALEEEKELAAIFERTYGPVKRRELFRNLSEGPQEYHYQDQGPEYLLVDGYNIIFAWEELKALAQVSFDGARQALADILCNYQGFRKCQVILVFDAYQVKRNVGEVVPYHNIHIVYTKEAETADMFIEKVTYHMDGKRRVRVATSDRAERVIILGHGAQAISAQEFRLEVERANGQIRALIAENNQRNAPEARRAHANPVKPL